MDYLWMMIIYVLVGVATYVFIELRKRNDKVEKNDKGFGLIYYKLSYRRKFIRTLWLIPVSILVLIFTHESMMDTLIWGFVIALIMVGQAVYNYKKWKNTV